MAPFSFAFLAAGAAFAVAQDDVNCEGAACLAQDGEADQPTLLQQLREVSKHHDLASPNTCTGGNSDPWATGNEVPCCAGLMECKGDWYHAGTLSFLCVSTCHTCTGGNSDPWATGNELPCCAGLTACKGDWYLAGTWSFLCVTTCQANPEPPANTGMTSCSKAVEMDSSSVWSKAATTQSCHSSKGVRGDGAFQCADASGVADGSSIYVNMEMLQDKVGCFVWETLDCQYPMKSVKHIDFDVEWDGCNNLWMAPLWTFSSPWVSPQGLSGEIDFVEECVAPQVNTNLGCPWGGTAGCVDEKGLGQGTGSNGPKHMTMTLDTAGNLGIQFCSIDKTNCRSVATYTNYLNVVYPTSEGRNNLYKFMSDVFNDSPRLGDGGWGGCNAQQNPTTTCKYAITNIEITSNSNLPVFADPNSKCYTMNAKPNSFVGPMNFTGVSA